LAPIIGTQSSGHAALGAAFSSLSQKLSSKASSGSGIKRNFALA
jgi:hypothetical protein